MRVIGGMMVSVVTAVVAACGGDPAGDAGDAAAATDAATGPTAAEVFDPTVVRRFELTVAAADWEALNVDPRTEMYVPATVRWGDTTLVQVGLRYKGSVGSLALCFDQQGNRTCPKLSMKLKFDEYVVGQRFAGLKRLDFHAMMRDPSPMEGRRG